MKRYRVDVGGRSHDVDVQEVTANQFLVTVGGRQLEVTLSAAEDVAETIVEPGIAPPPAVDAEPTAPSADAFRPVSPDKLPRMVAASPPPLPQADRAVPHGVVKAPMPGTILSVETRPGDAVEMGQVLVRLEAMKMVNAIKAPHAGVVSEVLVQPGQSVGYGHRLVTFEEA